MLTLDTIASQRRAALLRLERFGLACRKSYRAATRRFVRDQDITDNATVAVVQTYFLALYQGVFDEAAREYLSDWPDAPTWLLPNSEHARIAHNDWRRGINLAIRSVNNLHILLSQADVHAFTAC